MLKRILSVVLGLLAAVFTVSIVEAIGHKMFPVNPIDFNDKEALKAFMEALPLGALVMVFTAWVLGSFVGGIVTTLIYKENGFRNSIVIGAIILLFSIINMLTLPHPTWMWILSVLLIVPMAIGGNKLVVKFKK